MKVKIELELTHLMMIHDCVATVAKSTPLGLLAQPLLDMLQRAIAEARSESETQADTTPEAAKDDTAKPE